MLNIHAPAAILREMAKFVNSRDVRAELRGIHIETGQFGARLTATNGHILARYYVDREARQRRSAIVRVVDIKTATRICRKNDDLEVDIGEDCRSVTLRNGPVSVKSMAIEERYRDLRSVIPETLSGEPAIYDPEYIAIAAAFVEAANPKRGRASAILHHNGDGPAVMRGANPGAFALVMPRDGCLHEFSWPPKQGGRKWP